MSVCSLGRLIDEVPDRWRAAGDEQTLVHGDLHGGNVRLAGDGTDGSFASDRIIDWGDAFFSHPLFDLAVLDSYMPDWGSDVADRWLDIIGSSRSAWDAFRPLATVRLAVVYQSFVDNIERSEQIYHRDDIVPALRAALSVPSQT